MSLHLPVLQALRHAVERSDWHWVPVGDGREWRLFRGRRNRRAQGMVWRDRDGTFAAYLLGREHCKSLPLPTMHAAAEWLLERARDRIAVRGVRPPQRRALGLLRDELAAIVDGAAAADDLALVTARAFFLGCLEGFLDGACHLSRLRDCARKTGMSAALGRALRGGGVELRS